jgi:hypothetical protein
MSARRKRLAGRMLPHEGPKVKIMAIRLQDWQQQHPDVIVSGDGRWLVWKECLTPPRSRRFMNYFEAERSARGNKCGCGRVHEVTELAVRNPARLSSSFLKMVESA